MEAGEAEVPQAQMPQMQTYHAGSSASDLAARARELGVEHRAALIRRDEQRFSTGLIFSSRFHIAALASLDPMCDEREPAGTPEAPPETDAGFSMPMALLATIKSAVGPAVLYMPKGFEEGGLGFSLGMLMVSYALFALGASRLLESWRASRGSYAQMMGRAYGPKGTAIVRVTIVAQQCGICLTYLVFVAANLQDLLLYAGIGPVRPSVLCLAQIGLYAPLVCIRNVQHFAYTNLLANALILYSLLVLGAHAALRVASISPPPHLEVFNRQSFYLFVGTSAFVYEGSAALVVPLQEAVKPSLQKKFPAMYVKACGAIIGTYIIFGVLNWAAYGEATETVLTVNLPSGAWKASVQLAYTAAVVFTFPLQLFPAIQILKSGVRKLKLMATAKPTSYAPLLSSRRTEQPKEPLRRPCCIQRATNKILGDVFRVALVGLLATLSIVVVDSLDKLVALIGGLLGIPLAFVYPLAIHQALVPDSTPGTKLLNRCAMALGVVLGVACVSVTVATW